MKEIVKQYATQLKDGQINWTEFANILLDFDIEIEKIEPYAIERRNSKTQLVMQITFADRASNATVELEF